MESKGFTRERGWMHAVKEKGGRMHEPFSALLGQRGSLLLSLRAVDNLILNKNTKGEPKQISCGAHEAVSAAWVLGTHRALVKLRWALWLDLSDDLCYLAKDEWLVSKA